MTDNEQTQWAALDQALDEIARRGNSPWLPSPEGGDSSLISTARHLNALYAQERDVPDEQFVSRLEQRLMPDDPISRAAAGRPATGMTEWTRLIPLHSLPAEVAMNGDATNPEPRPGTERGDPANVASPFVATPNQRDAHGAPANLSKGRRAFLAPAVSMALLLTLVGAAGFILWHGGGSDEPRSIAFPAISEGTPDMAVSEATPENDGFLWELPASSEAMIMGNDGLTVAGNTVYRFLRVPTEFNGIEALDGVTGQTLWKATAYRSRSILTADDHGVYYFGFGETTREGVPPVLIALSPETGDELWRLDFEGDPRNASTRDGSLYIDTYEDDLIAIDTVKGEELWTYDGGSQAVFPSRFAPLPGTLPAIFDQAIVMFTTEGSLIGLDPETGSEIWRSEGYLPEATFLTAAGDTLVAMTAFAWPGEDSLSGTPSPANTAGPRGTPSPVELEALFAARAAIFVLTGIDAADGRKLWERNVAGPIQYPAATDTTLTVIGQPAIELVSGYLSDAPADLWLLPESEVDLDTDFTSRHVRGIDARSGELLWVVALDEELYRTVSAWEDASGSGGGIAATTSAGDIVPVGPWIGGELVSPDGHMLVTTPPLAGDFGFVALPIDGRLVGIAVESIVES